MKEYSGRDIERYVKAAEEHMRRMGDLAAIARRPLDSIFNAPRSLYRIGALLDLAQIGLHTVLDFGAGTCWLSAMLNRMGARTISLDVSETALRAGQALFESHPDQRMDLRPLFLSYDGELFPLEDKCVDRVLSFDAFHHVPNPKRILQEIHRILRPGGIFALSEPGIEHSKSAEAVRETQRYGTLEQDIDIEEMARLAGETGFGPIRVSMLTVPEVGVVTYDEYVRFMRGKKTKHIDRVRGHLPYHTVMALHKGPSVIDSRRPAVLRASIEVISAPEKIAAGEKMVIRVKAKNTGDTIWLAGSDFGGYVRVGAHLLDGEGRMSEYEYGRGSLPHDVKPGSEVEAGIELIAPSRGKWRIMLDMVDEAVTWFGDSDSDSRGCIFLLDVL